MECITKRRRRDLHKSYENFAFTRHPALSIGAPSVDGVYNDLMLLVFGFQVTYKVNNKERFEPKKDVTGIDTSASRLIQIDFVDGYLLRRRRAQLCQGVRIEKS